VAYEGWSKTEPESLFNSLPTELERTGDFSQTFTDNGDLRLIYDPWSTVTAPDGTVTRTPFPGNIIPQSRINPVAAKYAAALWKPREAPTLITHNYGVSTPTIYPYKNFSGPVDWQATENSAHGRFSIIDTPFGAAIPPDRPCTCLTGAPTTTVSPIRETPPTR
jgi:hypothetical protein